VGEDEAKDGRLMKDGARRWHGAIVATIDAAVIARKVPSDRTFRAVVNAMATTGGQAPQKEVAANTRGALRWTRPAGGSAA
jgi:hypothetical protein